MQCPLLPSPPPFPLPTIAPTASGYSWQGGGRGEKEATSSSHPFFDLSPTEDKGSDQAGPRFDLRAPTF